MSITLGVDASALLVGNCCGFLSGSDGHGLRNPRHHFFLGTPSLKGFSHFYLIFGGGR